MAQAKEGKAFDRFKELTRRLISTPKSEVDRKEVEYKRKRARRKKRS